MAHFISRLLAIFVVGFGLGACQTGIAAYEGPDRGFVVASIAAQPGTKYNSYNIFFRPAGSSAKQGFYWRQLGLLGTDGDADFDETFKRGSVIAVPVKPGDYEVHNFSAFWSAYPVQNYYSAREDFSIPFTVRPGETVYLGEFMAVGIRGKNIFGITIQGGPYFVLTDQQRRDMPLAKAKQPALGNARNAVANADKLGIETIRSAPLPQQ